jgi:mono/diheme cytochrome c family protein
MKTLILVLIAALSGSSYVAHQEKWDAPAEADKLKNPYSLADFKALAQGKKIYMKICWTCHGKTGKGDGPNVDNLEGKPADFTSAAFWEQSTGSIFWKVTNGKGNMLPYEDALSDKERWKVVTYLQTMKK